VLKGSGLVFVYPRNIKFKKLFSKPVNAADGILNLAAKAGLPPKISKLSDSTLLKTYQFGKGRIAVIDYRANHGGHYAGQALSVPYPYSNRWQAQFENNMVLLMRTMKWAADRNASVKITCPALADSPEFSQGKRTIDLDLKSNGEFKGELKLRLRNEFNSVIKRQKISCNFSNNLKQAFAIPSLASGKYYLDILVSSDGKTDNFGYFAFTVTSPVKPVLKSAEVVRHHNPIKAVLELNKAVNGTVEVTLCDSPYGRIWFKKSYQLNGKQINLNVADYYMPTTAGYLKCAVLQDGKTLAAAEKLMFFPNYKLENYLELAWSLVPGEYLGRIDSMQIVDKLGWRAGLTHPSKDGLNARHAAILNQRFVPYTTRIGIRKGEKGEVKQYSWFFLPKEANATQKALNGDESFCRPEVKQLWAEGVKHRVKNLSKYGPAIYTLGDENFFNVNAGYGKSDEQGFRDFVKQKYGTIASLNREWGTAYKSFAEVKHYSQKDAKDKKLYAAWFDHRQYMEKMYADMHHFLAEEIKKYDPDAKVGAEGSVPGNLEQTIKGLEFWGPYSDLVMDEVLRSIGGDKIRMLWWGGYVGSHGGRGQYPIPLWKDLLTGNVNGSAWYAATKAGSEGVMGADMDFAKYAKELIPFMLKVQNGLAQLLNTTPLENNRIAILWSHASDSARLLDSKFINPRDSLGTFIRFCYQNGLNFNFLTESMLGQLKDYKVLFLFGTSAISDKESAAILKFVKNGGTVIADLNPGILNNNLRVMHNNQLRELFGNITYQNTKAPALAPLNLNLLFRNKRLALNAAKANTISGLKPFAVKRCGKGDAILLNFSLSSAATTSSKSAPLDKFLVDLLSGLKIKPAVKVSGINQQDAIIRVRHGNGFSLIGILAAKQDIGKTAVITLSRPAYVYVAGEGYLKYGKTVSIKMNVPFKLISCFDKRPTAPAVTLSSTSAVPGKPVYLDLSGYKAGTVLFIQLRNPDGKMLNLRKKVLIVEKNMKKYPVHFAFNDSPGGYSLIVTDVASGLKSQRTIELSK
jgi:hypothetical protein